MMTATARLLPADDEDDDELDNFDAEMSTESWAKLHAAIIESDEQIATGQVFPAEVLLDDIRRICAEK